MDRWCTRGVLPTGRNSSVTPSNAIRRLPLSYCGKLEIPTPWMKFLHANKASWKERAAKEEEERKKAEAEKAALGNGNDQENGES
ncbi:hypothetical protein TELCIR_13294 [Teladorsagia circumcincta]|uniref:PDEase domain-containing protein n=1 Tax=Teladorsagia circumcincta TaxID=45464 RepID=A0A2G9U4E6_TELCI|nr:hypothetical protein TELCIR_13294 [Teladorsagia circumcincta]